MWLALSLSWAGGTQVSAADAQFHKGTVSIGIGGGLAAVQMSDINDFLLVINQAGTTRFQEINTAWEGVADIRLAVTDKIFFGLEGGYIRGHSEDVLSDRRFEVTGIPILLIGGATATVENDVAFRIFGGLGVLANGKLEEKGGGETSGTGFAVSIGGELEYRFASVAALTVGGFFRSLKVTRPEGSPIDNDFSGGTIRAAIRGYFGGKGK